MFVVQAVFRLGYKTGKTKNISSFYSCILSALKFFHCFHAGSVLPVSLTPSLTAALESVR